MLFRSDGNGTDVSVLLCIDGPEMKDLSVIDVIIDSVKKEKEDDCEWDTDSVVDAVIEALTNIGYSCTTLTPDYEISF